MKPLTSLTADNLFIREEPDVEVLVHLDVVAAAPDGGDHDDLPFLSLKLLHGPHLRKRKGATSRRANEAAVFIAQPLP